MKKLWIIEIDGDEGFTTDMLFKANDIIKLDNSIINVDNIIIDLTYNINNIYNEDSKELKKDKIINQYFTNTGEFIVEYDTTTTIFDYKLQQYIFNNSKIYKEYFN